MISRLDMPVIRQQDGDLTSNDIYIRPPSSEVDQAWRDLTANNWAWVSSKDLVAVGKDPKTVVKFPMEYGLGDDAYPVVVDTVHKLHCLNRIRQEIYFEYYFSDTFPDGNASDLHQSHMLHCLNMLRHSLMCDANTDFMTFFWYEEYELPFVDFNINRKCGDFDGVSQWANDHGVAQKTIYTIPKLPEEKAIPISKKLLRMLGQKDS
jgi:hypothetical protein